MKRLICMLFAIVMLFGNAIADIDIDFSSYTIEELYEIRDAAINEIFAKQDNEILGRTFVIKPGLYIVGMDIKPGICMITCLDRDEDEKASKTFLRLYESADSYADNSFLSLDWITFEKIGEKTIMKRMNEGNVLIVGGGLFELRYIG